MRQERRIEWAEVSGTGREVLLARPDAGGGFVATSEVVGGDSELGTRWDATYSVVWDEAWRTRRVTIEERITDRRLDLRSDGTGHWVGAAGEPIEDVTGCIDIDCRATPLTNTLPIRRLGPAVADSATIDVVYIDAPGLEVSRERQVYTRLAEHTWRFEQPSAQFTAVITVDADGFVIEYPGAVRASHVGRPYESCIRIATASNPCILYTRYPITR